jgi:hypothetical protein
VAATGTRPCRIGQPAAVHRSLPARVIAAMAAPAGLRATVLLGLKRTGM